jgi:hypothetical protein
MHDLLSSGLYRRHRNFTGSSRAPSIFQIIEITANSEKVILSSKNLSPLLGAWLRGLYRRSGIPLKGSPCPEDRKKFIGFYRTSQAFKNYQISSRLVVVVDYSVNLWCISWIQFYSSDEFLKIIIQYAVF